MNSSLDYIELNKQFDEDSFLLRSRDTLEDTPIRKEKKSFCLMENEKFGNLTCKHVSEKLIIRKEEVISHLAYVEAILTQLNEAFTISLLELESRKNTILAKIDLHFENQTNLLRKTEFQRRIALEKKEEKLRHHLFDIEKNLQKIGEIKEKNALRNALNAVEVPLEHVECSRNWLEFKIAEINSFDFPHKELCNKETQTLTEVSPKQEAYKGKSTSLLKQKVSKIRISGIFSDNIHKTDRLSSSTFKVYVPGGNPGFSNYYIAKLPPNTLVSTLLEKLTEFSGVFWDFLSIKSQNAQQEFLSPDAKIESFDLSRQKLVLNSL